jgi:hypothetical protein
MTRSCNSNGISTLNDLGPVLIVPSIVVAQKAVRFLNIPQFHGGNQIEGKSTIMNLYIVIFPAFVAANLRGANVLRETTTDHDDLQGLIS